MYPTVRFYLAVGYKGLYNMKKRNLLSIFLSILIILSAFNVSFASDNFEASDDNVYVIEDFSDGRFSQYGGVWNANYAIDSGLSFYEADTEHTLGGAVQSVHWDKLNEKTTAGGKERTRRSLYARMLNEDATVPESKVIDEYDYVNAWIYSSKAENQRLYLKMYFDMDNDLKGNAVAGHHYVDNVSNQLYVNWTGWKLVSYPIKNMRIRPNSGLGGSYEWGNGSIKINNVGFEAVFQDACDKIDISIDSIWFSKEDPTGFSFADALTSSGTSLDGSENVPVINKSITLKFNRQLSAENIEKYISVFSGKSETPDTDCTISASGNKVNIEYPDYLPENTDYKIVISKDLMSSEKVALGEDKTISFKTGVRGFYILNCSFESVGSKIASLPESGTVSAKAKIMNMTNEVKEISAFLAKYDLETNEMEEIIQQNVTVDAESEKIIELNIESDDFSKNSLDLIILDGLDTLNNYNEITSINYGDYQPETSAPADGISSDFYADITGSVITLARSADIKEAADYVIKATDESGKLLHIRTVGFSDNFGAYKFKVSAGDESQNIYIDVMTKSYGMPARYTVYYLSEADSDAFVNSVNSALSEDKLESVIKENAAKIGLNPAYDKYALYAEQLYAKKPFKTLEEIQNVIASFHAVLVSLNECPWDELSEFLEANESVTEGATRYREYANRNVSDRNRISRNIMLKAPFETFAKFCTALDSAVREESKSSSGSGGGGGGGSKGSAPVTPSKGVNIPNTSTTENINPPDNGNSTDIFADLPSGHWARDAVYSLIKSGAVSVGDDKKFRPDDSITREEFVKLAVTLFKYENKNNGAAFDDVKSGDWFKPYVDIAVSNGIIHGISDAEFGSGKNITRQDIAVILYRIIVERGYGFESSDVSSFADGDEIDDYAKDAVDSLHKMNLINGSDGHFSPNANATRAEAVQMLYNISSKIK